MIRKNWLEWVTLTISSIVVASTFGYLALRAMDRDRHESRLAVSVGQVSRSGAYYAVALTVRNEGRETAENVRVDVSVETPGGEIEQAELTISYVPYGSERHATALFTFDPRKGRVKAWARSFQKP